MDLEGCGKGRFTDHLFIRQSDVKCDQTVSYWVGLVIFLLVARLLVVFQSWRSWAVLYQRQGRSTAKKRRYLCGVRFPVIPLILTSCSTVAVAAWVLATTATVNLDDAKGSSLFILAVYALFHMFLGNATFLRYVRLGQQLVPLVRAGNQRTPLSSKSLEEEEAGGGDEERRSGDLDQVAEEGEENLRQHSMDSNMSDVRQGDSREPMDEGDAAVTASGIYSFTVTVPPSPRTAAGMVSPKRSADHDGTTVYIPPTMLRAVASPMRILFVTETLLTFAGFVVCLSFVSNEPDKYVNSVTIACDLFAAGRVLDGLMHYFQLGRTIDMVKSLMKRGTTHEDVSDSIKALGRQRSITVGFDIIYASMLFMAAASPQLLRAWPVFMAIDACVVAHNLALLVVHRLEVHSKRTKAKKRLKSVLNALRVGGAALDRNLEDRPKAFVSQTNRSSNLNRSSTAQSQFIDDAPTYEEAWDQGFRWRRWSVGYEKKERKAFLVEFRLWQAEHREKHAKETLHQLSERKLVVASTVPTD